MAKSLAESSIYFSHCLNELWKQISPLAILPQYKKLLSSENEHFSNEHELQKDIMNSLNWPITVHKLNC